MEGNSRLVTEPDATPSTLQRYYPCAVIGIAFLTVGTAFGMRNTFALFLIAVVEEFRWSRGLASGALMLASVSWTISAPVIGMLLDRVGPRIVLPGGAILMAAGFAISGMAQSIVAFYIGMGIFMGVGFAALAMTSQATFLSNWFIRRRGMAIGIVASGIGLGILLVVPWTQWLIAADLFHGKSFGAIIGAIALFIGAGAGIGPWLGGILFDRSGSYVEAFWVAQAMSLISMILILQVAARRNPS